MRSLPLIGFILIAAVQLGLAIASPVAQAPEPQLDLAYLKRLIAERRITSIEGLLQALPNDYKKSYLFVYESRSLQKGTMSHPRTILYGKDAKLVLSFEGDPTFSRYNNIELIEWNPKQSKFQFHSMDFDPTARRAPLINENVLMCTGCHRTDARPNFDSYNSWPGVYGSISRDGRATVRRGLKEYEGYSDFLANERNRGRYRYLPKNPSDLSHYKGNLYTVANGEDMSGPAQLAARFGALNTQRMIRLLKDHARAEKIRYLLPYALKCGTPQELEAFFPETGFGFEDYLRIFFVSRATREFESKLARLEGFNDHDGFEERRPINFDIKQTLDGDLYDPIVVQKFFFVLYRLGVNTYDFSLVFEQGNASMTVPNGTALMLETVAQQLLVGSELSPENASCAELRRKLVTR